jgi:hypothetical protein
VVALVVLVAIVVDHPRRHVCGGQQRDGDHGREHENDLPES